MSVYAGFACNSSKNRSSISAEGVHASLSGSMTGSLHGSIFLIWSLEPSEQPLESTEHSLEPSEQAMLEPSERLLDSSEQALLEPSERS